MAPTSLPLLTPHHQTTGIRETASGPFVTKTLVLFNNTLVNGNFPAGNGIEPSAAVFDSGRDEMFVANQGSDIVSVVSTLQNKVVATVSGVDYSNWVPGINGMAYDNQTGDIFVVSTSNTVSVISDASDSVSATLVVGQEPVGVVFDSAQDDVFVTNGGSNNVSVISATNNSVVGSIPSGQSPAGIAYVSSVGELFVTNPTTVTVISVINDSVVATLPISTSRGSVVYGEGTGDVFVSNWSANSIIAFSARTHQVLSTVSVPQPEGLAFDANRAELFATSLGPHLYVVSSTNWSIATVNITGDNLAYDANQSEVFVTSLSGILDVFSDSSNMVVDRVPVESLPEAVAFDGSAGELFVANSNAGTVSVISTTTDQEIASVNVGLDPAGLVVDNETGELFVANSGSDNVSIVSIASNTLAGTIGTPRYSDPSALVFDNTSGTVLVAEPGTGTVEVLDPTDLAWSYSIPLGAGSYPIGLAYDGVSGVVFVSEEYANSVEAISGSNYTSLTEIRVGDGPREPAFDPLGDQVFVPNYGSDNVSVISASNFSVVRSIALGNSSEPWGAASAAGGSVFVTDTASGSVSMISGSNDSLIDSIPVGSYPISPAVDSAQAEILVCNLYQGTISFIDTGGTPVTFQETGLPSGTLWGVALNDTSLASISNNLTFTLPNGTYSYVAGDVPGYVASNASGSVGVHGSPVVVVVRFVLQPPARYVVTFTESGLPFGTPWQVSVGMNSNTSNTSIIGFVEPNGSYSFVVAAEAGYIASLPNGSFGIDGFPIFVGISFSVRNESGTPFLYELTLQESGLPSGDEWSARIGSIVSNSTNGTISVLVPNGTYALSVDPPAHYAASFPQSLKIEGYALVVQIGFFVPTYVVIFSESGLPAGLVWSVSAIDVSTRQPFSNHTSGTYLTLSLANGTYSVNSTGPSGYVGSVSAAHFVVQGISPSPLTVIFAVVRPNPAGRTSEFPWLAFGSWLCCVGILVSGAGLGYRRYRISRDRLVAQEWVKEIRERSRETRAR